MIFLYYIIVEIDPESPVSSSFVYIVEFQRRSILADRRKTRQSETCLGNENAKVTRQIVIGNPSTNLEMYRFRVLEARWAVSQTSVSPFLSLSFILFYNINFIFFNVYIVIRFRSRLSSPISKRIICNKHFWEFWKRFKKIRVFLYQGFRIRLKMKP